MGLSVETYVLIIMVLGGIFLISGILLHFIKEDTLQNITQPNTVSQNIPQNLPPNTPYNPTPATYEGVAHSSQPAPQFADIPIKTWQQPTSNNNKTSEVISQEDRKKLQEVASGNNLKIDIHSKNLQFFKKQVYMYFDEDRNNIYTGEDIDFDMNEISGIRRIGRGILSYDGFKFVFKYTNGLHNFSLDEIDYVAFYPSSIVLVHKENLPAALFFMDETDSIRKLLEIFKS